MDCCILLIASQIRVSFCKIWLAFKTSKLRLIFPRISTHQFWLYSLFTTKNNLCETSTLPCLHISWSNRLIWIFTTKEKVTIVSFAIFCFVFVLFFIQLNYSSISVRTHLIPFNFLMIYEQYRVCHFQSSEILVIFIFNFSICLHSLLRSWFGHFVVETFLCDLWKRSTEIHWNIIIIIKVDKQHIVQCSLKTFLSWFSIYMSSTCHLPCLL